MTIQSEDTAVPSKCCYLTPAQLHRLREAVEPIDAAFDSLGIYLVGSCLQRANYRDVDVRLMLSDEEFRHLFGAELNQYPAHATAFWTLLMHTLSADIQGKTGLNIDFQIQAMTPANKDHRGPRNSLHLPPPLPIERIQSQEANQAAA